MASVIFILPMLNIEKHLEVVIYYVSGHKARIYLTWSEELER